LPGLALLAATPPAAHAQSEETAPAALTQTPPAETADGSPEPASVDSPWLGLLDDRLSTHFQSVIGTQAHPDFYAAYSGHNSMLEYAEAQTAFISTLQLALRLTRTTEIIFDPELSGGHGLSQSLGVAAYPSGIVYRVGNPSPSIYLARLLVKQTINLGGGTVAVEAGPNATSGSHDRNSITISAGRLSVTDVFDHNAFANDPAQQFFDWALMASGAWDYPADTRGYSWGVLVDASLGDWSARAGIALEPLYANLEEMDWNVIKAHGLMAEGERRWSVNGMPGTARLLVFFNQGRMGSYQQALSDPQYGMNVAATRAYGRTKYGAAVSADQRLSSAAGVFLRASWSDGANETWAFTEIDRCLSFGAVHDGSLWWRRRDEVGGAVVISGLASIHRAYLAAGGYGFIIGDGALHYGPEIEGDFYYRAQVTDWAQLSFVYQPVVNPAYNRDRGPIHIFTARARIVF